MSAPIQRPASNSEARKAAASKLAEATHPEPTAAAVRAAQAEALYAARDALYRGEGPDLAADSDIVYGEWLGNRADRLATDTAAPEGFVDGSDFIDSLAAPVAVEGVETVEWRPNCRCLPTPVEPETSEPEGGESRG